MRTVSVLVGLCLAAALTASAGEKPSEQGFVPLFNGKDLTGWAGSVKGYVVEDGKLVCKKKGGGQLYTRRDYANFVLRFDFKIEPGGNNGLAIRNPPGGHAAYQGMELQILDDDHKRYAKLQPYQYHGSIYGVVPAKRGHLKPAGQWNAQEVTADGTTIKVVLNGVTIKVDGRVVAPIRGADDLYIGWCDRIDQPAIVVTHTTVQVERHARAAGIHFFTEAQQDVLVVQCHGAVQVRFGFRAGGKAHA